MYHNLNFKKSINWLMSKQIVVQPQEKKNKSLKMLVFHHEMAEENSALEDRSVKIMQSEQ